MKTPFLLLVTVFLTAMLLVGAGQARAQSAPALLHPDKMKDGYAMHQGRMIRIQGGQVSPLNREVSLKNGLKVSPGGWVSYPGKSRQKLSEGYVVNMEGHIVWLDYDMMRYAAIQEHSQKTVGNTDAEVIITDNGIILAASGEKKKATEEMLNRRIAIIQERNGLIQQKATLLNKAKDKKAQQNSPEIKEVNQKLHQLNQELKALEQLLRQL
jgi:hypothetical protein